MKKSRGIRSTMNYYSDTVGSYHDDDIRADPTYSQNYPPSYNSYSHDYHSYPTAPRDYPMRSLNRDYQSSRDSNDSPRSYQGERDVRDYQNGPIRYPDGPQTGYQNGPRDFHQPRDYRHEPPDYHGGMRDHEGSPRNRHIGAKDYSDGARDYSEGARDYSTGPRDYRRRDRDYQGQQRYSTSPRPRYRTVEDYHYDYRGGYRPTLESDLRDGYTTDGSGSGYRDGSIRGYENYRYPENEALLPRDRSPYTYQANGSTYTKGETGGEKQPFLGGVEPVRLTPSWENSNLPKEELNFKNVNTFETFEVDMEPPKDRFKLVFMTLVLHGVGTLMPWNMFITAKNYFVDYKLVGEDGEVSAYATNFLPYIGYAAQVPNVLFNWLNIFIQFGGNLTTRIVWSILIEVVVFVFTVVLAMVDSSEWPGVFFWITIGSVVILNVANGIYQNTVYGMAARLPFAYTGAVVLGSNISGTFTAIINIISIALAPNIRTSAIYYFITALFILLACFDTYFALPLNRFFRYHEAQHDRAQKAAKRDPSKPRIPYGHIFKKAFPQLFNVFLVFFVTLAVFPAVLADTCRTEENFPVPPKYYQAVTCFLTFNIFAMFGNMLPGLITWPSPRFLCIPVILRIFLIPAFVLCHFYPVNVERVMPVLIDSDWAYWVLAVILGLTSGYYSSLAMMYCPRTVEPEYAPVAGMMGAASLITGIFAGINFQIACTWAVTKISFEIPGYEFPMRNCTDRLS
ncbi:equilibrative nucleoside transporter 1 isoform X2 [Palaemon carinicauda]|uniref:equilibrative nucleoside transporter 1 isoform X2 n=1 Tax=Palaemon carinicauda TaxID=392227 RepID=UPI0035B5CB63